MPSFFQTGRLGRLAQLALLYSFLSFLWSIVGFISPTVPTHYHEYTFPAFVTEIGGHFLFGFAAGLASLDMGLAALVGSEAVLIDSDHVLATLGLPVLGRLSHSVSFGLLIGAVYLTLPQKVVRRRALALAAASSLLSHLSYDVYVGSGQFPLLAPFSFEVFVVPQILWPALELAAILVGGLARVSRHDSSL